VPVLLYVHDCDAWFERAVRAGWDVIDPIEDLFWGDRVGKVKHPYGHTWTFATHKLVFSDEGMAAAMGHAD
jgi:PhnB protein